MYEEGYLSVWVGTAESDQSLEEYVQLTYSDDGDLIPSQLLRDFDLTDDDGDFDEYDEGCREIAFYEKGSETLESCLREFSYSEQFVEKVMESVGNDAAAETNAVVILFNYRAKLNGKREAASRGVHLRFIDTMQYEM